MSKRPDIAEMLQAAQGLRPLYTDRISVIVMYSACERRDEQRNAKEGYKAGKRKRRDVEIKKPEGQLFLAELFDARVKLAIIKVEFVSTGRVSH